MSGRDEDFCQGDRPCSGHRFWILMICTLFLVLRMMLPTWKTIISIISFKASMNKDLKGMLLVMHFEIPGVGIGLVTRDASMPLLSSVSTLVLLQLGAASEGLVALLTPEWLFTCKPHDFQDFQVILYERNQHFNYLHLGLEFFQQMGNATVKSQR